MGLGDTAAALAAFRQARENPAPVTQPRPSPYAFGGCDSVPLVSSERIDCAQPVLLVDSFLFNGEIAVEVRLNATAHLFDRIVVVEAWDTHSPSQPRKTKLFAHTPYWRRVFARFGEKVDVVEVRLRLGTP
jgi:hypothetical protein